MMMLVGLVLSERVLARLTEMQQNHLVELSQSYLDGLSSASAPSILREDNWEVYDAIARAQEINKGLHPLETVITNGDGAVIAASDPKLHPIGTGFSADDSMKTKAFSFTAGEDTAKAMRTLSYPGRVAGIIYATFDTRHLAAERRDVLMALALTNGALTVLLAAVGWLLVTHMMRPVEILSEHLGVARETLAVPIPDDVVQKTKGEFGHLFRGYNGLVRSMREREDLGKRLAEEERLGSLGRLASAVAHEINNPLGGLFNALSTLRTHGHSENVRVNSLGLLERGLNGIRDVVRTTLAVYRTDSEPRDLTPADIDDLGMLVAPEGRRKFVSVRIDNRLKGTVPVASTPIRQALLNLLLNAVAAAPEGTSVDAAVGNDDLALEIIVSDHGGGMPDSASAVLTSGYGPAPIEGGGLGLWTTGRLVSGMGGRIEIQNLAPAGTSVKLVIPIPHAELSDVA
ncbi:ATP-binding protein [Bradyrhizobium genosp. P]|uniref:ATP-binding protein n=1 Tax=Bradyrhizobium genosp. P TaxID=83641 RepID=UPI003CE7664E